MAFLRRGMGRQRVGSRSPEAQQNPDQGMSRVGFPAPTLALGLSGTLPKRG